MLALVGCPYKGGPTVSLRERNENKEQKGKRSITGELQLAWSGVHHQRWSGVEVMPTPKMGCLGVGGPVGGLDAAGDAPARVCGDERLPAVGVERGCDARRGRGQDGGSMSIPG